MDIGHIQKFLHDGERNKKALAKWMSLQKKPYPIVVEGFGPSAQLRDIFKMEGIDADIRKKIPELVRGIYFTPHSFKNPYKRDCSDYGGSAYEKYIDILEVARENLKDLGMNVYPVHFHGFTDPEDQKSKIYEPYIFCITETLNPYYIPKETSGNKKIDPDILMNDFEAQALFLSYLFNCGYLKEENIERGQSLYRALFFAASEPYQNKIRTLIKEKNLSPAPDLELKS